MASQKLRYIIFFKESSVTCVIRVVYLSVITSRLTTVYFLKNIEDPERRTNNKEEEGILLGR